MSDPSPREPGSGRRLQTNGITLSIVEAGPIGPDAPLIVLCHGFPELSYSWRHQFRTLAGAGFHVVAPDMRGYGQSDRPAEPAAYDLVTIADDLTGLLDALDARDAVFVGHDWGAASVWTVATVHPERVRAVAALSVPYRPRGSRPPVSTLKFLVGNTFFYMLYFQAPGHADQELARDPRTFLARFYYSASGDAPAGFSTVRDYRGTELHDVLDVAPDPFPAWLTPHDLDHAAAEFARTGFTGGLNYYRAMDRTWERTAGLADAKVTQPALFVAGDRDLVLRMGGPSVMDGWVEDLRDVVLVPGAGHWVQQERPDEVNGALFGFLSSLD
jgi:pimeloyl-ACP methyl ester carboxylesterase